MRAVPAILMAAACVEPLPDDTPYVVAPRVLAVRAEPPEAPPGAEVTLSALVADADGAVTGADVAWAFCTNPKPLAELGPVSPACLVPGDPALAAIGEGPSVVATLPADACSRFGPNPPPPVAGEPPGRPTDPDVTGGYHQPVVLFDAEDAPFLAAVRTRCGLANVTQETFVAWNQAYVSNASPEPVALAARVDDVAVELPAEGAGEPGTVPAGVAVELTVSWTGCADDAAPCAGAERYVRYDPPTGTLDTRREAISATWFTTRGTFAEARNGRAADDPDTTASNAWTTPEEPGEAWVAVVLRDERGGVGFATWRVRVGNE